MADLSLLDRTGAPLVDGAGLVGVGTVSQRYIVLENLNAHPLALDSADSESVVERFPGVLASLSVTKGRVEVPASPPEQERRISKFSSGPIPPTPGKLIALASFCLIDTNILGVSTLQVGTLGVITSGEANRYSTSVCPEALFAV
ncbi:hypothetical protein ACM74P_13180 [Pseudomonas aeruginosa]